jgi:medium-chain acyl-[acyl-carrier-protein] hydrolase
MASKHPWLASYRPRPAARIRLLCFPYAGGAATTFRNWHDLLPATIEVCPIELPGRGQRFSEPPYRRMEPLLTDLVHDLQPLLDNPVALFGHSLGAILAYEIARRREIAGADPVLRLFLSAQRAPHRPDPKPPLHALPEDELLEELRKLGGTPPEIFAQPELLELFLPILRADFELGETFAYPSLEPLACPISAFAGEGDAEINGDDVMAWQVYTRGEFRVRFFSGDHFFLQRCEREVTAAIAEDLCARR